MVPLGQLFEMGTQTGCEIEKGLSWRLNIIISTPGTLNHRNYTRVFSKGEGLSSAKTRIR